MSGPPVLQALVVDDEAPARLRLRQLIGACTTPRVEVAGEASHAQEAGAQLQRRAFDLVLLDIGLAGGSGLALAQRLNQRPSPPAIIFVTGHPDHALQAFELGAIDYLTKPLRLDRLQMAVARLPARLHSQSPLIAKPDDGHLLIHEHGYLEHLPLADVLYVRAELKYLTVRTRSGSHLMSGSLQDLQNSHPGRFVRIHRNTLVASTAVRRLMRDGRPAENAGTDFGADCGSGSEADRAAGQTWSLEVFGLDERLPVSRRLLPSVRAVIKRAP